MLHNDAMVVRLSVSQWTARKFDKSVTRKVASDYSVNPDVGRYRKVLIADEAIRVVTKVVSEIRTFHYENTLPWDDGGGRLLPVAKFEAYSAKMRELRSQFETAVGQFVKSYPEYQEEARTRLRRMFNEGDYPDTIAIQSKFNVAVDIEPIPMGRDFRVSLQESEAEEIRKEIDQRAVEREGALVQDLYQRIDKVVSHVVDKLSDPTTIFRDSLVENVAELVALLPDLNVTKNENLKTLCKDIQKKLLAYEPDQLRTDVKARKTAVKDAKDILAKMSGYTGIKG